MSRGMLKAVSGAMSAGVADSLEQNTKSKCAEMLKVKTMNEITDKEILDFVKAHMAFGKDLQGILQIKEVNISIVGDVKGNIGGHVVGDIIGNVCGDLDGSLLGNIWGDVEGDVAGNVEGNVLGNVDGNIWGDVYGDVVGNVYGASRRRLANYAIEMRGKGG